MNLKFIKVGVAAIILSFTGQVSAQEEENQGVIVDKIIAKVDDYIILKSELDRAYLEFLSRGELSQGDAKCQILGPHICHCKLLVL